MPTTTPNSKSFRYQWDPFAILILCLFLSGGFLFSGCIPPAAKAESFFQLAPESARYKAQQTRTFDTSDEKELLSASAAVLQDLGFQIQECSMDLGVLKAGKERGSREYGQEIGQGFILALSTASIILGGKPVVIPVDVHQQIAATLATRPVEGDPSRYTVRIVFHRSVWKGEGFNGDNTIPAGAQRYEMIYDPEIYQQFFAKLSKSVFLEAHQI